MTDQTFTEVGTPWTVGTKPSALAVTHALAPSAFLSTRREHANDKEVLRWQRWNASLQDIDRMQWLGDDWDGADGRGPSDDLVAWAVRYAERLRDTGHPAPSRVATGADGTVVLEWQDGETYTEYTIPKAYAVEQLTIAPGRPPDYDELDRNDLLFLFPGSETSATGRSVRELTTPH